MVSQNVLFYLATLYKYSGDFCLVINLTYWNWLYVPVYCSHLIGFVYQ